MVTNTELHDIASALTEEVAEKGQRVAAVAAYCAVKKVLGSKIADHVRSTSGFRAVRLRITSEADIAGGGRVRAIEVAS